MNETDKKKIISKHIEKHSFGMIGVSPKKDSLEQEIVRISHKGNLELIFDTVKKNNKYKNLKKNPEIALAIGWSDITIEYEGLAYELEGSEKDEYQKIHLLKIPNQLEFINGEVTLFKVTPKWVKCSDSTKEPPEVLEMSF